MDYTSTIDTMDLSGITTNISSGALDGILAFFASFALALSIVGIAVSILTVVAMWKIYQKAGKPGWASIVPIYNIWVLFEIADLPGWLCLIPVANGVGMIFAWFRIAKKFNKGAGFGFGLLLLNTIFILILGFDKSTYGETETKPTGPDFMAPDPNEGGTVNLMAPDPVSTMPETPIVQATPEMVEAPSLDSQIDAPTPVVTPIVDVPVPNESVAPINETPVQTQTEEVNAFKMPMLASDQNINPIEKPIESLEANPNNSVDAQVEPVTPVMPAEPVQPTESTVNNSEEILPPSTATKKCGVCGYENPSNVIACIKCGEILK